MTLNSSPVSLRLSTQSQTAIIPLVKQHAAMKPDVWLTTSEAAQLTGYSRHHIWRLIQANKITCEKWGRDWKVSRSSLKAYLEEIASIGQKRGPKSSK